MTTSIECAMHLSIPHLETVLGALFILSNLSNIKNEGYLFDVFYQFDDIGLLAMDF